MIVSDKLFQSKLISLTTGFQTALEEQKQKKEGKESESKGILQDYEALAEYFTDADAVITYMMQFEAYTPKTIEAVSHIFGMMALAFPERFAGRGITDKCDESVDDLSYAYRNFRYRSAKTYLETKDPVLKEAAADELRGYMLSLEQAVNDLIDTCDYALIDEEDHEEMEEYSF